MSLYFNGGSISAGSGGGSDDTYTKAEINGLLSAKSNTGLDNLNAGGQMVVDSQNGTISNCILEIPQNLKIEISGNTLTLKSGSVVTLANGSTYTTQTITSDVTKTISNANLSFVIFLRGGVLDFMLSSRCYSGSSAPETLPQFALWYNTNEKVLYYTNNSGSTWSANCSYPLCMVNTDSNGVPSFAKDSNGNDMIFNGACYVGHHAVVYPNSNVGLIANGYNSKGSLDSIAFSSSHMTILELINNATFTICYRENGYVYNDKYYEVDTKDDFILQNFTRQYVKSDNMIYTVYVSGGVVTGYNQYKGLHIIDYSTDSNNVVTNFTIRQPYEGARDLLTDNKQDVLTSITGYDSTQTQTLKNINGVLQWVTD